MTYINNEQKPINTYACITHYLILIFIHLVLSYLILLHVLLQMISRAFFVRKSVFLSVPRCTVASDSVVLAVLASRQRDLPGLNKQLQHMERSYRGAATLRLAASQPHRGSGKRQADRVGQTYDSEGEKHRQTDGMGVERVRRRDGMTDRQTDRQTDRWDGCRESETE